MKYSVIDHTADLGIHIYGADPKALFENAAFALSDLVTDVHSLKENEKYKIMIKGEDWPDMMVNWLRELLFFWTGKNRLVTKTKILEIDRMHWTAKALFIIGGIIALLIAVFGAYRY